LDEEERSFAKTLDRGETLFDRFTSKAASSTISGADVWRLYDTYGFPVDLTRLMAQEKGLTIDEAEFLQEQELAKARSRGARQKGAQDGVQLDVHALSKLEKELKVPQTNDEFKYESGNHTTRIKAIFHTKDFHDKVAKGNAEQLGLVLASTNFYAEQGGQEYDFGTISTADGDSEFVVEDVQLYGSYVLHIGYVKKGSFSVDSEVVCTFDELRRLPIRNNHTVTHILNFALQKVLGNTVDQKGSLVNAEKTRFDFSYKSAPTMDQLKEVERICSIFIKDNKKVYTKLVPLELGRMIYGLRAVFGETYPDPVRVVSVGVDVDEILKDVKNEKWAETSIEFCGGT
jgi:alanyl-tRNA synthetase